MKKIGIISDTHGVFDDKLRDFLAEVDEIWHAGDIGSIGLADKIAAFKPLRAVYGNIDDGTTRRACPEFGLFECEQVKVLMTHIGGYPGRYNPEAVQKIAVCRPAPFLAGHSHILKAQYDRKYSLLYINPGAAGKYGFHTARTAIRLAIAGSDIRNLEVGEWNK